MKHKTLREGRYERVKPKEMKLLDVTTLADLVSRKVAGLVVVVSSDALRMGCHYAVGTPYGPVAVKVEGPIGITSSFNLENVPGE